MNEILSLLTSWRTRFEDLIPGTWHKKNRRLPRTIQMEFPWAWKK